MKYCKKCVQPDTRPSIKFDEESICPACRYAEKLDEINWDERNKELKRIIQQIKEKNAFEYNTSEYDCIIGVSGGKDSTRQALFVKRLGLNSLLVSCVYPPEQQTERGTQNINNMISLGFDHVSISLSPKIWKNLMRQGFLKYGNWAKSTEMALFASVPRLAIAYRIPLIFWGDNPAIQFGELCAGSLNWDGNKMRNINTIAGGPDSLLYKGLNEQDIIWYRYPPDDEIEKINLQLVYLGYFWKNFSKLDNGNFSIAHGLEIRDEHPKNSGSLHSFEALDEDFVFVNQMLKHLKLGFGKVTDEVCELIRTRKMTREEGIELVKKYDGKCSQEYIQKFCDYLEISLEQFWKTAESFRNLDLWEKNKGGQWNLKYPIK